MNDNDLAIKINNFIGANPYATRNKILRQCNTSLERCLRLHADGLIKFPLPLTSSQAATIGARNSNWRTAFKLPGSPR